MLSTKLLQHCAQVQKDTVADGADTRIYRMAQSRLTHFRTHFCLRCGWWGGGRKGIKSAHRETYVMPFQNLFGDDGSVEYVVCLWAAKRICMYPVSYSLHDLQILRSRIAPVRILQKICRNRPHTTCCSVRICDHKSRSSCAEVLATL